MWMSVALLLLRLSIPLKGSLFKIPMMDGHSQMLLSRQNLLTLAWGFEPVTSRAWGEHFATLLPSSQGVQTQCLDHLCYPYLFPKGTKIEGLTLICIYKAIHNLGPGYIRPWKVSLSSFII